MDLLDIIKGGAGIVKDVFDFGKDIFGSDAGKLGLAALAAQQAAKERLPEMGGGTKLAYPGPAQLTRTMGVHPTLGTPLAYYDYGPPIQAVGPTAATAATGEEERAALERLIAAGGLGQDADGPSATNTPGTPMENPQTGILDSQGVPLTVGDLVGQVVNVGSMLTNPLGFALQAAAGKLPGTVVKGMMTPVVTINPQAIALAEMLGVSVNTAQGFLDLGFGSPGSTTEQSTVGMDMFGPDGPGGAAGAGPGADSSDSSAGDISGAGLGWAKGGPVAQYAAQGGLMHAYAHGGHVNMEDGGFVLTKRAVDGAGGPRGLAALVPGAQPIRGPGTGTSDSIPATIHGAKGQTPARVSNGEAYVPRDTVQRMGGARQMYNLMNNLQRRA